jgi:hypothetical protein
MLFALTFSVVTCGAVRRYTGSLRRGPADASRRASYAFESNGKASRDSLMSSPSSSSSHKRPSGATGKRDKLRPDSSSPRPPKKPPRDDDGGAPPPVPATMRPLDVEPDSLLQKPKKKNPDKDPVDALAELVEILNMKDDVDDNDNNNNNSGSKKKTNDSKATTTSSSRRTPASSSSTTTAKTSAKSMKSTRSVDNYDDDDDDHQSHANNNTSNNNDNNENDDDAENSASSSGSINAAFDKIGIDLAKGFDRDEFDTSANAERSFNFDMTDDEGDMAIEDALTTIDDALRAAGLDVAPTTSADDAPLTDRPSKTPPALARSFDAQSARVTSSTALPRARSDFAPITGSKSKSPLSSTSTYTAATTPVAAIAAAASSATKPRPVASSATSTTTRGGTLTATRVRALFDYKSERADKLSFNKGDLITLDPDATLRYE